MITLFVSHRFTQLLYIVSPKSPNYILHVIHYGSIFLDVLDFHVGLINYRSEKCCAPVQEGRRPILAELEPEFDHLRQNSVGTYLWCKLLLYISEQLFLVVRAQYPH